MYGTDRCDSDMSNKFENIYTETNSGLYIKINAFIISFSFVIIAVCNTFILQKPNIVSTY